ncbi:MAG: DUF6100 family protein [Clostridia bacterium]|nr:DUF6100 family protein [Clostridia bacterium]
MNKNFIDSLNKVSMLILDARQSAETIKILCEKGDNLEAYEESFRLERLAEKLALHTRKLPVYTGHPKALIQTEYVLEEETPVEIGYTEEGWFSLRLPLLLPHKNSGDVDYLKEALYPIVGRYIVDNRSTGRIYGPVIMIFRHVYSEDFPERKRRDHDNVEVKALADIVTLSMLVDDAPAYCSHYYCSGVGNEERTEVYLVPKEEFEQWIAKEKRCQRKE